MQQPKAKNAEMALAAHTSTYNSSENKTFFTTSAPIGPSQSLPGLQLEKALVPIAEHPLEKLTSIGVHLRDRLRNQINRGRQTQISAPSSPSDTQPHHPHLVDVSKADLKPSDTNQRNVEHMTRRLRRRFVVFEKPDDVKKVAAAHAADAVAIAATAVPNAETSEAAAAAEMEEAALVPSRLLPKETLPHGATRCGERRRVAAVAAVVKACRGRRGRRRLHAGAAAVAVAPEAAVAEPLPQLHTGTQMAVQVEETDDPQQTDPRISTWIPPASPWGLIEEALYDNPWRLLVACILLNRTTGRQVRQVIGPLWRAYPTAEAMAIADPRVIQDIVRPLGLHAVRAARLVRFSQEFISKEWTNPSELHGVGRYGEEAYFIFCRGRWREMQPEDKDLRRYLLWLESTGGEGSGLEREDLAAILQCVCEEEQEGKEQEGKERRCGRQPQRQEEGEEKEKMEEEKDEEEDEERGKMDKDGVLGRVERLERSREQKRKKRKRGRGRGRGRE